MDVHNITLTKREWNVALYALAHYAAALDAEDEEVTYAGPLETAPEVRALAERIRRSDVRWLPGEVSA